MDLEEISRCCSRKGYNILADIVKTVYKISENQILVDTIEPVKICQILVDQIRRDPRIKKDEEKKIQTDAGFADLFKFPFYFIPKVEEGRVKRISKKNAVLFAVIYPNRDKDMESCVKLARFLAHSLNRDLEDNDLNVMKEAFDCSVLGNKAFVDTERAAYVASHFGSSDHYE